MKNSFKILNFLGALLIKLIFYLAVSIIFIWLFYWAGIINGFGWKYAVVMALGLLFLRIFLSEILLKPEK
jgi:hypothetical protein